jgi:phosphatidylethanolamine/phosphatidyl-N-methylethanolamine N-methyltransferase
MTGERGVSDISQTDVADAYARWAPIYDMAFTAVMKPGRRAAAAAINRLGGRVLDVGVGTGLELPMFDAGVRVTGVDLSEPMLEVARKRVKALGLANVDDLIAMDAMNLAFPDGAFDAAVAPYVLTTVPDPARLLDEMTRVVKPGGEVVLVNHFGAERGLVAAVERWLGKRGARLGWRPEFPWSVVGDWLARRPDVELRERRRIAPAGLFALIRLARR